ncbi:MAG: hypothetical protein HQL69_08285 [Magnetococcales bacterium]|nr:hypothetical protein [Magnetococcales bacterium]
MIKSTNDSFSSGIKLLLVCHLYYIAFCALYFLVVYLLNLMGVEVVVDQGVTGILLFVMMVAPGIVGQLVYVIPITVYFAIKRKNRALKGMFAGAFITGFLNVAVMIIAAYTTVFFSPDTSKVNRVNLPPQAVEQNIQNVQNQEK